MFGSNFYAAHYWLSYYFHPNYVVGPDKPGLDYTADPSVLHYTSPTNNLHFTADPSQLHYTAAEGT